ncbi:ferritin heavy chain-like [Glossophaga mutica]
MVHTYQGLKAWHSKENLKLSSQRRGSKGHSQSPQPPPQPTAETLLVPQPPQSSLPQPSQQPRILHRLSLAAPHLCLKTRRCCPGPSFVRHNYHPECEAAVNNHINVHFHASYVYSSVAFCFDREDVALKHFSQLFLQRSNKEKEHAEKLVGLQKQRGGRIRLRDISSPPWDEWESGLRARDCALHAAKKVNQSLLSLHQLATEKGDVHLCDFLESHHLHQQGMFIKVLGDQVVKLRKMGAPESGLAEYLFEKLTLGDSKN